jgi:hypothetical protein
VHDPVTSFSNPGVPDLVERNPMTSFSVPDVCPALDFVGSRTHYKTARVVAKDREKWKSGTKALYANRHEDNR